MSPKEFFIPWRHGTIYYDEFTRSARFQAAAVDLSKMPFSSTVTNPLRLIHRFQPLCLALFLHNRCNLDCRYCYAKPRTKLSCHKRLDPRVITTPAEWPARNARQQNQPLHILYHGGGEPLLEPDLIRACDEEIEQVCIKHRISQCRHLTTNGVINPETTRWASVFFHTITLSYDLTPEVHNRNRPSLGHRQTSVHVLKTADILRDTSATPPPELRIRATVTADDVEQMEPAVGFLHTRLPGIKHIQFEPVYLDHSSPYRHYPARFVQSFIRSHKLGKRLGMDISYAGARITQRHDRFCPIKQSNLSLTPDAFYTACFLSTENQFDSDKALLFGDYDQPDMPKLNRLLNTLEQDAPHCQDCFNRSHCARGCPNVCPVRMDYLETSEAYDCSIERWIGFYLICDRAGIDISTAELENMEQTFPPRPHKSRSRS
ncbi:MAG: hypothetical protein GY807_23850 [Gammaproteobacteria bacterium]|nr:hypothetical protein [Gammaproteobacteria bacterium]